jgi:hypothetical protein
MMFPVRTLFTAVALFALAACGSVPQPFRNAPQIMTNDPLLDMPTAVGIAVLPVRGIPEPLSGAISRAAANRLQAFEIPAEAVPVNAGLGFTLEGVAQETAATSGHTVNVVWTLRSRRGQTTGTHTQSITIPETVWRTAEGDTATLMGGEAATAIAALLGAEMPGRTTAALAPRTLLPTISVRPVEGAPGDGREALRLAVLQVLNDRGFRRDDVMPDIVLTCVFESAPLDGGMQKVGIVWRAVNRAGLDLGTARLDNAIPNGALDGPWGPTAFAVADAAAPDLVTLLTSTPFETEKEAQK